MMTASTSPSAPFAGMMAAYMMSTPTLNDIHEAQDRIAGHAHRTPVFTSRSLNEQAGASLFFKCENLQRVGAFKFRGATNAVRSLADEDASKGVATHSSGNHAQALALAARERGIPAYIVMPQNAPAVKRAAVAGYGGEIILCESTLAARESTLSEVVRETGATFIHPYEHPMVIAGQGTAAVELLEQAPGLDMVITPVGGGGLLAGTAIAVKGLAPSIRVLAAEPAGADDAHRSLRDGQLHPSVDPQTICDGLLTSVGEIAFAVMQEHVERVVLVEDDAVVAAMRLIWERMKLVIEPSAAVPLAAILGDDLDVSGMRIGVILSGGNVDLGALPF